MEEDEKMFHFSKKNPVKWGKTETCLRFCRKNFENLIGKRKTKLENLHWTRVVDDEFRNQEKRENLMLHRFAHAQSSKFWASDHNNIFRLGYFKSSKFLDLF